jgi:hypothetical protein
MSAFADNPTFLPLLNVPISYLPAMSYAAGNSSVILELSTRKAALFLLISNKMSEEYGMPTV